MVKFDPNVHSSLLKKEYCIPMAKNYAPLSKKEILVFKSILKVSDGVQNF